MPSILDEQIQEMTDAALPRLAEVYDAALMAQAVGSIEEPGLWAEFRRIIFRIMMFADLAGRAEAVEETKAGGIPVGTAAEDLSDVGLEQFAAGDDAFITAPFIEAIDIFSGRVPRLRSLIEEITPGIRQMAFTITGIESTTGLEKLQAAILRTLDPEQRGGGLSSFIQLAQTEAGANLTAARLETVYRTNVVQALSDGRDAQLKDPGIRTQTALWMLNEVHDVNTRGNPAGKYPNAGPHFQMDGFIEDPGHSVWQKIGWPGGAGFNCRRSVSPITWPTAISKGWANSDRTLNKDAIDAHNFPRWDFINSGEYPDEGWGSG